MRERYFKDYAVGQTFGSGRVRVDKESIIEFCRGARPHLFHLDEALAADTFFRGLAASGWHTAAMTMRLLVEFKSAGGVVGAGEVVEALHRQDRGP